MEEIEVGLRISKAGIGFFGIDEVNDLLSKNASVYKLEPFGAITQEEKDSDGNINIILTGFSLKVILKIE
jgi:hypothetical protein